LGANPFVRLPNSSPDLHNIPDAPWILRGQAVAFLASWRAVRLLVRYEESPVGFYLEHALSTLTRRGPHVFQMSVNLEASRRGGREIWGFPKTLESLDWKTRGNRLVFRRENQTFHVRTLGPTFPLALPFWTAQQKGKEWVRVPGSVRAWARLGFRGRQLALVLTSFEMKIDAPKSL